MILGVIKRFCFVCYVNWQGDHRSSLGNISYEIVVLKVFPGCCLVKEFDCIV